MDKSEMVAAVRRGERIDTETSLYESEISPCPRPNHIWRVILCDDPDDVVECAKCGKQRVAKCDFDEEYS
jgi:hypothetical protein